MGMTRRFTLNLDRAAAIRLERYAGAKGITMTEAVRRALAILDWYDEAQARKAAISITEEGEYAREIVFLGW